MKFLQFGGRWRVAASNCRTSVIGYTVMIQLHFIIGYDMMGRIELWILSWKYPGWKIVIFVFAFLFSHCLFIPLSASISFSLTPSAVSVIKGRLSRTIWLEPNSGKSPSFVNFESFHSENSKTRLPRSHRAPRESQRGPGTRHKPMLSWSTHASTSICCLGVIE